MPITFSFSVCPVTAQSSRPSVQLREAEESPAARRELQLLEDHRPWEMLDNMALAIIDQTYAALLEILGHAVPPPEEGDGGHVTAAGDSEGAHRCRGDKVREILRVRTALEDMRREVDLGVIARRRRFQKRPRVVLITYRPEADMDVDREDEAEEVTKRLKALHV
ncbi:hypothetical protein C2845_PM04G27160 [Panicum miliaceum]|uniref:Uncharacterized protein n=1 Tax=Panicum miliaceum TaxID=4540 RepID=A0A3L6QR75_PANMI|nr:hypothetical protein C2845_PM04G27160 [Panicum miliaceum]